VRGASRDRMTPHVIPPTSNLNPKPNTLHSSRKLIANALTTRAKSKLSHIYSLSLCELSRDVKSSAGGKKIASTIPSLWETSRLPCDFTPPCWLTSLYRRRLTTNLHLATNIQDLKASSIGQHMDMLSSTWRPVNSLVSRPHHGFSKRHTFTIASCTH
jgi:hypothetical protein